MEKIRSIVLLKSIYFINDFLTHLNDSIQQFIDTINIKYFKNDYNIRINNLGFFQRTKL